MSLEFQSARNGVSVTYLPAAREIQDFTISFWIAVATAPEVGYEHLITRLAASDATLYPGLVLIQNDGSNVKLAVYRGERVDLAYLDEHYLLDAGWHHVAIVSRVGAGDLRWYVDGALQPDWDTEIVNLALTQRWRSGIEADRIVRGNRTTADSSRLAPDAQIAEEAYWSVPLSQAQITSLAAGRPASLVNARYLISYERFFDTQYNFLPALNADLSVDAPVVTGSVETIVSTPATTHTVSLPASRSTGDLAVIIGEAYASSFDTPAGWTIYANNANADEIAIWSRVLDGTEGSTVAFTTIGLSNSEWHAYTFSGARALVEPDPPMVSALSVPRSGTREPTRVLKIGFAKTRRTDNTLTLPLEFAEYIEPSDRASSTSTSVGRLVSGVTEAGWDGHIDAFTVASSGVIDTIRCGAIFVHATNSESGVSDEVIATDHPPVVTGWQVGQAGADTADRTSEKRKDPNAILDYVFDWTDWLGDDERIASCSTDASSGLTAEAGQTDGYRVFVWASGGTHGKRYTLRCRVETNQGRTNDLSMPILVINQ